MDNGFKIPQSIPQDLLLIQEYIGVPPPPPPAPKKLETDVDGDDDISSSSDEGEGSDESDIASEEEIAADLIEGAVTDEDVLTTEKSVPSESDTSSDSDSDSSEDADGPTRGEQNAAALDLADDDEDPVPVAASGTYFQTKHEIQEAEITVPEVDQLDAHEILEKVGEVMNIVDRLAIVRGLPSEVVNRGSDRALDSDTLLVFDDRKVLGYIYETFGPTTQPFYQVKFSAAFPLDPERVRVGREVFHVPTRSRFVFVNQIKAFKGSDASNVHDEEPADDELEFSDDEAEAAYRSRLKRKRGESRARSVASSRQSTPNPTLMRDQELSATDEAIFSRNAYDEHGPYDIDYAAPGPGPSSSRAASRPAPIPYDDPYGDDYTAPDAVDREMSVPSRVTEGGPSRGHERAEGRGRGRDGPRGRGGGRGRDRDRDRGGHRDNRDRGRGRGGRGGRGGGEGRGPPSNRYGAAEQPNDGYSQQDGRPMSPTSLAIARATGQSSHYDVQPPPQGQRQQYQQGYTSMYPDNSSAAWGYGQQFPQYGYNNMQHQPYQHQHQQQHGFMPVAPFVQRHINPRFASAFGLGMGMPGMPQNAGVQSSYLPPQRQLQQQQQQQQYTTLTHLASSGASETQTGNLGSAADVHAPIVDSGQQQIPGLQYTPSSETQSPSMGSVDAMNGGGGGGGS
ncbi:hypothetical protein M413DRAFT_6834 [Hebeloma cylindrosporum]|uniref:H/ACA ribonucleoprotein complex non-core subunit NAF1 n=1 Tax=Hebeloma cylindrosporum TaxID=76867 RepID=A0A0C3CUE5_HEBCY|nr:hypothetical protein M413DRAFT_6834 [Hebeloma cylindrosporum h7]